MPARAADLTAIRREAAMVRALLEELEQLTGTAAEHVGQQLAEGLVTLARRLVDASTAMGCPWGIDPARDKTVAAIPGPAIPAIRR
jgi:hypothetical protein